jgi:hypothetical protein
MNSFKNKCKRESTKNKIESIEKHEKVYWKQSINTWCICSLFKYCSNFVKMNYEKSIICYLVTNKKLVVRKKLSK